MTYVLWIWWEYLWCEFYVFAYYYTIGLCDNVYACELLCFCIIVCNRIMVVFLTLLLFYNALWGIADSGWRSFRWSLVFTILLVFWCLLCHVTRESGNVSVVDVFVLAMYKHFVSREQLILKDNSIVDFPLYSIIEVLFC